MNNEMYVVIGENKETGETWICETGDYINPKQLVSKEEAEEVVKDFSEIFNYATYRIAKLSWLD